MSLKTAFWWVATIASFMVMLLLMHPTWFK